MMLLLRAVTLNEEPISKPLIGRFDERGGTVGRSDEATLTLPDPERMISRVQAQILHRDDRYWIENLSAVSPILHNGRALSTGMRVVLQPGDEIRIVGYVLEVALEDDPESATLLAGRTVVPRVPSMMPPARSVAAQSAASAPAPAASAVSPAPGTTGARPQMSGDVESLWRAFLEGAGIDAGLPNAPSPELMHSIGEMLSIAVGGLQRLITMRAQAKNEMQAQMTMIRARDNNPLKFSPDAQLALQMLLKPAARGFLDGPESLRDALTDLQAHQIGMTAGMRAVLDAVLERLDPAKLESLPADRSMLDFLGSANRRARLWELYVKEYGTLREEAQEGSQRILGEALRQAYEAQVRNLDTATADRTETRDARPRR
jgi:predicted component of type VI protein secretion system